MLEYINASRWLRITEATPGTPAPTRRNIVISSTPAGTSIPLTGTWFSRVGLRPYELLGIADHSGGTRAPIRTLPRLDLAA